MLVTFFFVCWRPPSHPRVHTFPVNGMPADLRCMELEFTGYCSMKSRCLRACKCKRWQLAPRIRQSQHI
jgi:hypothetical protein